MARIQPVLTPAELALIDQMAALTGSKRTEVIKNALAVYHWFVRQALTGSRVVARKATGEEIALETAELAVLESKGNRLSPEELGLLAKQLAAAPNPIKAARIKERLTRGFYGICRRNCWRCAAKMFRPLFFSICSTAFSGGRSLHLSWRCWRSGSTASPKFPRASGTSDSPG